MMLLRRVAMVALLVSVAAAQTTNVLLVTEASGQELNTKFEEGLKMAETETGETFSYTAVPFERKASDSAYSEMCAKLKTGKFSAVVDLTWGGWIKGRKTASALGLPYIRMQAANHLFVQAADDFLKNQKAVDAALIFEDQTKLDQSLYYIIGNSFLRIIGAQLEDPGALERLQKMRPRPSNYIAWGSTKKVKEAYNKAKSMKMIKRDTRWTLVFDDFDYTGFPKNSLSEQTNFLEMRHKDDCCIIKNEQGTSCNCKPMPNIPHTIVKNGAHMLAKGLVDMKKSGNLPLLAWDCEAPNGDQATRSSFNSAVGSVVNATRYTMMADKYGVPIVTAPIHMTATTMDNNQRLGSKETKVGEWTPTKRFMKDPQYKMQDIKRFFRVGVVLGKPWAWITNATDPLDPQYLDPSAKNLGLEGYCVDLLMQLAKIMEFEFEIVPSKRNQYGKKLEDGSWNGVVGDLISGEIDISVATLTMTTEREEVIDFVAPYFDQSGISILLRKKEPKQSIFKFMQVLRAEVWFGILGAVFVVAFLIWALDRFSPYSYYNNKASYPEGARDFTIGESLWFALTSLTPQGGGECPKALSGRVLVAAYWLFIVLMLATFTANLAAFLTVERMQTTIQNLEEMARQSKINYTTVADSPYLEYFTNMAGAEDELYKKWKEITLNSTSDQTKYRVWDYPVREQYTHLLKVIKQTGPFETPEDGFKKVDQHTEADFAFIHDASEIRYQFYQNCNFTEIGEPFAEQPLAVAVQQGSHLQKEISRAILELQKERYFETLSGRYWSSRKRNQCPVLDDSQGITLRSLGGIFLATLTGLLLSMLTLAYEVWQQKKNGRDQVTPLGYPSAKALQGSAGKIITVGSKQVPFNPPEENNGNGVRF